MGKRASAITAALRVPLYMRIVEALRARIASGSAGPNQPLPSESQLMREFDVSRVTVRQALSILEEQGLIFREQGKGTFVRPARLQHDLSGQTTTILEALAESGIQPDVTILELEHTLLPAAIAGALKLDGKQGVKLRRLYACQGAPIALVTLYLPLSLGGAAHLLAKEENKQETVYSIFESEMGLAIKDARHVIRTVELDEVDAHCLGLSPGDVCLSMERLTFSMQGRPLELMTYIYPPGRMHFEMTLPRRRSDLRLKLAG